jgi:hypothetical protein
MSYSLPMSNRREREREVRCRREEVAELDNGGICVRRVEPSRILWHLRRWDGDGIPVTFADTGRVDER